MFKFLLIHKKKILTIIIFYLIYKIFLEIFWIQKDEYIIDDYLLVQTRVDQSFDGFQDFNHDKKMEIKNLKNNKEYKISFQSLENDIYFFIDTNKNELKIVDIYLGKMTLNISSLNRLDSIDCFSNFGNCGGIDNDSFKALGTPVVIFDYKGFHK